MYPLITGTLQCTNCKHKFNWHYIVPQHRSGDIVVVSIPNNSRGTSIIKEVGNKVYLFQTRCPKCDDLLEFEYTTEDTIKHF